MKTESLEKDKLSIDIGMEKGARKSVAQMLMRLQADETVLYVKLRNFHWNVTGMNFQTLHLLFEEQYTALALSIDTIAERMRSLGHFAPGSMEEYLKMSRLKECSHHDGKAEKMLKALVEDHESIIRTLRRDQEEATQQGDAVTGDLMNGLMAAHEKMAWMLRAHLG
jgi:starvation-inducible DNA-binding protein